MLKKILQKNTDSNIDTIKFAKLVFEEISPETKVIFLNGKIGSGKTTFVKGIAKAMKIDDIITSPTYGYKKKYDGLVHYDLYLNKKVRRKEILSMISEDLENNLIIIEWGKKIPKIKNSIFINFKYLSNKNSRKITVYSKEK